MTTEPQLTPIPITLASERDVVPRNYLLHIHSQKCSHCGSIHEWSAVYGHNHLRSRMQMGKYIQHLVPVENIHWNLPMAARRLPQKTIPFCQECIGQPSLTAHLPIPDFSYDAPREAPELRSIEGGRRTQRDPSSPKTAKPSLTLNDILDGI